MFRSIAFLVVIAAPFFAQAATAKETRVALVIGNGAYKYAGALTNPPNDARAIGTMIGKMGFDSTDLIFDRDRDAFREELRKFADKARDADLALVYFAGHGMEIAGANYLLPTETCVSRTRTTSAKRQFRSTRCCTRYKRPVSSAL